MGLDSHVCTWLLFVAGWAGACNTPPALTRRKGRDPCARLPAILRGSLLDCHPSSLRVVMHSDLKIVDPIWTTAYITRNHGYMIYDTLFAMDEEGVIRPQMVDKYDERRSSSPVAWFCAERRSRMSRNTALMTMVVAALVSSILAADAHDSWISRGGYRNP